MDSGARAAPDRLLVLGGTGFLGAHVVRAAAAAARFDVHHASRRPAELERLGAAPAGAARTSRVSGHALDCAAEGALESLLDRLRPRAVIVCAALSRAADCEADPSLARALNVALPRCAARWCAATGARLIHVSSDLVFGGRAPRGGYRESDPAAPLGAYGRSKLDGERAVLEAFPAALVVRLPLLFGSSFGRGIGATDALFAALARGERPALFADEWRTPLAAPDAAGALIELVSRRAVGLLHVSGAERVSRWELGLRALRAAGRAPEEAEALVRRATRAELGLDRSRPADVSLDGTHARALLATGLPSLDAALARDHGAGSAHVEPPATFERVFYDGTCGLCHATVRFALRRDRAGRFRYAPLQGATFARLVPAERRAALPDSLVVLDAAGGLHVRAAAVARVLSGLGGGWPAVARVLRVIPRPIADGAYRVVAGLRRRLLRAPRDLCPVGPAESADRFDD